MRAAYPGVPVFCVEPNTPTEVGKGVLAFAAPDEPVDADLHRQVRERFARLGAVVEVPERLMGVAGACMGVAPAYWALDGRGLGRRGRAPRHAGRGREGARDRRRWRAPPSCCAATTATR